MVDNTAIKNLAVAIVTLAAADYRREMKKSFKSGRKTYEAQQIERFFRSELCAAITSNNGETILKRLQREYEI